MTSPQNPSDYKVPVSIFEATDKARLHKGEEKIEAPEDLIIDKKDGEEKKDIKKDKLKFPYLFLF